MIVAWIAVLINLSTKLTECCLKVSNACHARDALQLESLED